MKDIFSGKKTFIVCGLMLIYAVLGLFLKEMDAQESIKLLLEAFAIAGLRLGIK